MNPQFPIYIPSKGRWESRLTARFLASIGVPYRIVVEASEADAYRSVIEGGDVLVLDPAYQRAYDACDTLGETMPKGSGPARNFIWDHAIASGASHHWVMDDNIRGFGRYHRNDQILVSDGTVLRCMEDFVLRYTNIGMAGPNYMFFVKRKQPRIPPFYLNTRVYSCNLIRSDVPFRWRGRFNEDTDLSLRLLKAKWCTVLFNAFLQYKVRTMSMKGGNTDTIYVDGTLAKSRMIVDLHPDVARLTWRFGRPHHYVDYGGFTHVPLLKAGVVVGAGADDYGMRLETV
jgi:hypothetical protein